MVPPPFLQAKADEPYSKWIDELVKVQDQLADASRSDPKGGPFHIVYFSHRLGFRATKLSVTAAWQSIVLAIYPSWSLTTLFHEYLHIHTKSLLSDLYPFEDTDFDRIYAIYSQRLNGNSQCQNLPDFIKVIFMETAGELMALEATRGEDHAFPKITPSAKLRRALKAYFHEFDEIFVHILDFRYFHRADPDLYIKSIWSSWLILPFAAERLHEYVFRTIAAVSHMRGKGKDRIADFDWSMEKLKTQVESLIRHDFVRNEMIDALLTLIDNEEEVNLLRHRFFVLTPLIQVLNRFLVFPRINEMLFAEEQDEDEGSGVYRYPEVPQYYTNRIESPVAFLIAQLKRVFDGATSEEALASYARKSLWLFQAINSTLRHNHN